MLVRVDYPAAVASLDGDGMLAAIDWCCEHMEDGDTLTVWTSQKSNLLQCPPLEQFVNRHSDVEHVTDRGGAFIQRHGPVLMAWADMNDIGNLARSNAERFRALCVIPHDPDRVRPWVSQVRPVILGDGSAWGHLTPTLDPVVIEALKSLTGMVNHGNTIGAGTDKDLVVSALSALRDAGIRLDGGAMQGWALAHGWAGGNPGWLARYAADIDAGKRPRSSRRYGAGYVDGLRRRVSECEPRG